MADENAQDGIVIENEVGSGLPAEALPDFDPSQMPSLEELLSMVDGMKEMSEQERDDLKAALMGGGPGQRFTASYTDYLIFITMISIILLVFVFFGYKLYKSLTERDRKREEKLKSKQAKKKK